MSRLNREEQSTHVISLTATDSGR